MANQQIDAFAQKLQDAVGHVLVGKSRAIQLALTTLLARGHKGQKSRSGGNVPLLFNGGAVKYWKQFPKRGFNNKKHAEPPTPINLDAIAMQVAMKRLDPTKPIGLREMQLAGMFKPKDVKYGVKLLANGKNLVKHPLNITVNRVSRSAIYAVESRGGQVKAVHMNRLALRTVLRPEKFIGKLMPRHARPPPKYQPYYTSWRKRGYLHPAVQMRDWFEDKPELEEKFAALMEENMPVVEEEEENNDGENKKKQKKKRAKPPKSSLTGWQ